MANGLLNAEAPKNLKLLLTQFCLPTFVYISLLLFFHWIFCFIIGCRTYYTLFSLLFTLYYSYFFSIWVLLTTLFCFELNFSAHSSYTLLCFIHFSILFRLFSLTFLASSYVHTIICVIFHLFLLFHRYFTDFCSLK